MSDCLIVVPGYISVESWKQGLCTRKARDSHVSSGGHQATKPIDLIFLPQEVP